MEQEVRPDRVEVRVAQVDSIQHVRLNRRGRIAADPVGCCRQRVLVQVEQRDLRALDRPSAVVEKPASADPDIEVARADVTVVPPEHLGAATSPDEAVREPEDKKVVDPQRERRVDALASLDFVRSRPLIGHSRSLRLGGALRSTLFSGAERPSGLLRRHKASEACEQDSTTTAPRPSNRAFSCDCFSTFSLGSP